MNPPSLNTLRAAQARIASAVVHTPLLPLPLPEGAVFAKAENLQRTGSFKLRGATNFIAQLDAATRARGVVTHSSGNHGQGVACAAAAVGIPATVVIPNGAAAIKVARTQAWGATVVRCENDKASREGTAERIAQTQSATLVPPYDHPWIVEGQASVGLEIVDDLPDVANVLVCVGGGGLLAGIAAALRARGSKAQILGVEPALAADAGESFARGEIVAWPSEKVVRTIADGVRTQALGAHPFGIIRALVDGFVAVDETAIIDAAAWYLREGHLVVEPTGAITLAAYHAIQAGHTPFTLRTGPTVLLISGGNIEPRLLAELATR